MWKYYTIKDAGCATPCVGGGAVVWEGRAGAEAGPYGEETAGTRAATWGGPYGITDHG